MTHRKHFKKHDGNRDIRKLEAKGQLFFERVMCVCQVVLLGFLRPQATKGFITDFVHFPFSSFEIYFEVK